MGSAREATAQLTFTLQGEGTRMWDIKVSQVECNNPSRPPKGCLQYFTEATGTLTTFNYRASNQGHLPNHKYAVCFRREVDFCCMRFQVCAEEPDGFSLSTGDGDGTTPVASRTEEECTNDYIGIPESSSTCMTSGGSGPFTTKYCGGVLNDGKTLTENAPICVCSEPIMVHINTDNADDSGVMAGANTAVSKGLCLDFEQLPCDS